MPTPPEIYLSKAWSERPVNIGEIHFIRNAVQQVVDAERAQDLREWRKETFNVIILAVSMAVPVILYLAF